MNSSNRLFHRCARLLPILLCSCTLHVSTPEKELLSVLEGYEAATQTTGEEIASPNAQGIEQLDIADTGTSAIVTGEFVNASRAQVLEEIAKRANIELVQSGVALGGLVTAHISREPLEQALNKLLAGEGIAIVRTKNSYRLELAPATMGRVEPFVAKTIVLQNASASEAANYLLALVPGSGSVPTEASFVHTGTVGSTINEDYGSNYSNLSGPSSATSSSGFFVPSPAPPIASGSTNEISEVRFAARLGNNALYLYGPKGQVERCTQYLRQFDTPPEHVMIEAMVLSVDTEAFENFKAEISSLASGRWSNVMTAFGSALGPNLSFTNTAGASNPTEFSALLKLLVTQNIVRVITRPYVVTLSGNAATVNITSDRYLLVQEAQNGAAITTPNSISAGVILRIVPTVLGQKMVRMHVNVEESDFGVPTENVAVEVDKNNATSVAQLPSGRSMIVGGLMLNRSERANSGVPYLRHIPLLNLLFSEQSSVDETQEVVAIVTPYIWKPSMQTPLGAPAPLTFDGSPSQLSELEKSGQLPNRPGAIRKEKPSQQK